VAGVEAEDYVYDEEPDEAPGMTGQELMEIDGELDIALPKICGKGRRLLTTT
jgi:hypothetical protein